MTDVFVRTSTRKENISLDVELTAYLRGDEKFDGLQAMKDQIARDCERARRILIPDW